MSSYEAADFFWVIFGILCVLILVGIGVCAVAMARIRKAHDDLVTADVPQPPGQPTTKYGLQCPWTFVQTIFTSAIAIDLTLFCAILSPVIGVYDFGGDAPTAVQVFSGLRFAVLLTLVVCFVRFSTIDPRADTEVDSTGLPKFCKCKYCDEWYSGELRKHCWDCNKCVVGFDHHCQYLNQCVGSKNYSVWYLVVMTTCLNFWLELGLNCYGANQNIHHSDSFVRTNIKNDVGSDFFNVVQAVCMLIEIVGGLFTLDLFAFHTRLKQLDSPERPMTTLIWLGRQDKYPQLTYNWALREMLNNLLNLDHDQHIVSGGAYAGMLANHKLEAYKQGKPNALVACLSTVCVFCLSGNSQGSYTGAPGWLAEERPEGEIAEEERSCCDKIARTNFILVSLSHDDVAHQALRGDSLEELFKQMDSNNDGVLEQIELEGAIRHLGLDPDMYLKQLQDKMTERHGKRVITLPQLKEATRRVSSLKKAEAAAMLFDQSVSGTCMTLSELQSLEQEYQRMSSGDAKECRFSFRSSNAKSIMEWADKDGDGMLSRQEFIVAVLGKNALSLRQSAMPAMLAVMADTSSTSAADGNGTQVPLGVADSLGAVEPANAALGDSQTSNGSIVNA